METQKIVNLLNNSDNESLQNLQQENGTLLMTKIMDNMAEEMKVILLLNLRQKLVNQIFVITQMQIFLSQEIKKFQMLLEILMLHLKIELHLQDV